MYKVISKQILNENIHKIGIKADNIAYQCQPGQCIIIVPDEYSRRISFTSIECKQGCIYIFYKEKDPSTKTLANLKIGDSIYGLIGPLGNPTENLKKKRILSISEGMGAASLLSTLRVLKKEGNKITSIAGFKSKKHLILESQIRLNANKSYIATEDGSFERRATIVDMYNEVIAKEDFDFLYMDVSLNTLNELLGSMKKLKIPCYYNLTSLLASEIDLTDLDSFVLNNQSYSIYYDGPFVDIKNIDFNFLTRQINAVREYRECQSKYLTFKNQKNGSGIFPKLFSGLVKSKL